MDNGWELTANRCIAFLDIAGTKDRVKKLSANEFYEQLIKVTKVPDLITDKHPDRKEQVYYSVFSDSLVFISKDDSKESLTTFLDVVTFAFASSIRQGLPIKAIISYGEMTADRENKIFFGQPLIDAFLIQETILDYYGVVFDDKFKQKAQSANWELDGWKFKAQSFYKNKKNKKITSKRAEKKARKKAPKENAINEYYEKESWHLDWFRVLRTLNGYNISTVDYALLENADIEIEKSIRKLYAGNNKSIIKCLNNTIRVFGYNKRKALGFMQELEKYNLDNNQGHGE